MPVRGRHQYFFNLAPMWYRVPDCNTDFTVSVLFSNQYFVKKRKIVAFWARPKCNCPTSTIYETYKSELLFCSVLQIIFCQNRKVVVVGLWFVDLRFLIKIHLFNKNHNQTVENPLQLNVFTSDLLIFSVLLTIFCQKRLSLP